ncbi:MAG: SAVED domain-containing protein [Bifidobacteriaceae bacterium]|jgi:hypothetical protein|nr:SAVED domain-containing protein [Bifidobacteriaceae bacterium]
MKGLPTTTAKAGGRMFISYQSTASDDVDAFHSELRRLGIATWVDKFDLGAGPIRENLVKALEDPSVAGCISWITNGIEARKMIVDVELPTVAKRLKRDPAFYWRGICAGGFGPEELTKHLPRKLKGLADHNLLIWDGALNHRRAKSTAELATAILTDYLSGIEEYRPADEPLTIRLNADPGSKPPPKWDKCSDLDLYFGDSISRELCPDQTQAAWEELVLRPVREVVDACRAISRPVHFHGLFPTPAQIALGMILGRYPQPVYWRQWNRRTNETTTILVSSVVGDTPEADVWWDKAPGKTNDILVLIGVSDSNLVVEKLLECNLPDLYKSVSAIVRVGFPPGHVGQFPADKPETIARAVEDVWEAIGQARREGAIGGVHVAGAMPAAFAIPLGRRLAVGVPFVQTYDLRALPEPPTRAGVAAGDASAASASRGVSNEPPKPTHSYYPSVRLTRNNTGA